MPLKGRKAVELSTGRIKAIAYGEPGAGKTFFALGFPKPYFIDIEGGAKQEQYIKKLKQSSGSYFGPEDGSRDFQAVLDEIKSLATEKHDFQTLVIDSVSKIFDIAVGQEVERLQEKNQKDEYGKSKKPAIAEMRRLLRWLDRIDMNVWLISHEVAKYETIAGESKAVGKTADVWDKVKYDLDLSIRVEHPGEGTRFATIDKTRLESFPKYSKFYLQENGKDVGYEEFAKRFGQEKLEGDSKPIALATEDQVNEINRLLGIYRVDDNDFSKILSRGNAETVEELSQEHAAKMIEWLNKKGEQ